MKISLAFFFFVGLFAQFVDGVLGMGYGVTSSTFLVSFGVYPAIASSSVHLSEVFVSLVSGVSHFKLGNVRKDLFVPLVIFGVIGGIIGAIGLVELPTKPVRIAVGSILFVMGMIIIYRFTLRHSKIRLSVDKKHAKWKIGLLGFFAAMIDAIGGGGWGPVCTPSLVISGTNPQKAVGSVNLAEFFVSIAITITFILSIGFEKFRWDIAGALLLSGIIMAPIAAWVCNKLPFRVLGILVGIIVIILSLRIIVKAVGL